MRVAVRRLTLCSLLAVWIGLIAGCADLGVESKKIDYKSASKAKVPTLEIPPDLTSPTRDDRLCDPPAHPFFAELPQHLRNLPLVRAREKLRRADS